MAGSCRSCAPPVVQFADGVLHLLLYDGLGCAGVNWFVADGEAAGQEVFHLHLHLIPRNPGDGFGLHFPPDYRQLPERKALDCAAHTISGALADTPPATSD